MKKELNNIIIVGGLHGDEPTGITVAKYFQQQKHVRINAISAHEDAISAKKRFLETDLNRSFSSSLPISLEEQLAESIKKKITSFDYLLDIHNTRGDFTTCAITTVNPNKLHLQIAMHFGFERIVIMPPSGSLISQSPHNSLSLEIAFNETDKYPAELLIKRIKTLSEIKYKTFKLMQYQFVQSVKTKTLKRLNIQPSEIQNFAALSEKQKSLLHLPMKKNYFPIFAKRKFVKGVAFELVEEVN